MACPRVGPFTIDGPPMRRSIQATSGQVSNVRPTSRSVPAGVNPHARCSPTLASFGNVMVAAAVW